jgi:hypothetical protein
LTGKADRALCNEYIQRYHYPGYKKPFGYRQRYFIEAGPHRLGCIVLSGPAKALTARDRWIGWNDRRRLKNLPRVLNNSRYPIFPRIEVENLASHVLLLLETFVDPARFHGGCYRPAGRELLGRTTGEGLVRPGKQYRTSPKLIFAKPLQADFRRPHQRCLSPFARYAVARRTVSQRADHGTLPKLPPGFHDRAQGPLAAQRPGGVPRPEP